MGRVNIQSTVSWFQGVDPILKFVRSKNKQLATPILIKNEVARVSWYYKIMAEIMRPRHI